MDIQLPVLDGYEATRRIKAEPELRAIPIIAVTSYALSGDEAKALAAGCDGYVAKPFSPRQLLATIRKFLGDRRRRVGVRAMREPPRILIVDDNPANLEILETRLTRQGYEVVTATDGDRGAGRARARRRPI